MNPIEEVSKRSHCWLLGKRCTIFMLLGLCLVTTNLNAQGTTAFTFKGYLELDGTPANGLFDFEFSLYEGPDPLIDPPRGTVFAVLGVNVQDGEFVIEIDFGPGVFDGTPLWLETRVRQAGGGPLTSLFPLQKITPVPYATFSVNSAELDGLDSTDFVKSACKICIGWADSNGSSPTVERCHNLNDPTRNDNNYLAFAGDVDENDRLWIWMECP